MHVAAKSKILQDQPAQENADLSRHVPEELAKLDDPQTAIPRIAKDAHSIRLIERAVHQVPTSHSLHRGDARYVEFRAPKCSFGADFSSLLDAQRVSGFRRATR